MENNTNYTWDEENVLMAFWLSRKWKYPTPFEWYIQRMLKQLNGN